MMCQNPKRSLKSTVMMTIIWKIIIIKIALSVLNRVSVNFNFKVLYPELGIMLIVLVVM